MLNQTFIYKGKRAKSKNIELQSPLTISAAEPNYTEYKIPGRNGTIVEHDGTFKNRSILASCYLLSNALERDIDAINAWLMSPFGYARFEDSEDTKHFMLARALYGIEKKTRGELLNPFTLEFDAKPQRFLKSGENAIKIVNGSILRNPTAFPALPIIQVDGFGDISIKIGSQTLQIFGLDGTIYYNSENDAAYNHTDSLDYMVNTSDKIEIPSGETSVTYSSTGEIRSVSIIPRWWEI